MVRHSEVNFILLGSFLLAFAIEEVGLHHRLALKLLSMVPGDPKVRFRRRLGGQELKPPFSALLQ